MSVPNFETKQGLIDYIKSKVFTNKTFLVSAQKIQDAVSSVTETFWAKLFLNKVDSSDSTEGFLSDKIIQGNNVTIDVISSLGSKTMQINASGVGAFDVSKSYSAGDVCTINNQVQLAKTSISPGSFNQSQWHTTGIFKPVVYTSTGDSGTTALQINADLYSLYELKQFSGTLNVGSPIGSPLDGQEARIRVQPNGPTTISLDDSYVNGRDILVANNTSFDSGTLIYIDLVWNAAQSMYELINFRSVYQDNVAVDLPELPIGQVEQSVSSLSPAASYSNFVDIQAHTGGVFALNNPVGTPVDMQKLRFRITNASGSPTTLNLGSSYEQGNFATAIANTALSAGQVFRMEFEYDKTAAKWVCFYAERIK